MTLEQRIEALEKAVKDLSGVEITAANDSTANYTIKFGVNYDSERERILDNVATLMLDSQCLSRL